MLATQVKDIDPAATLTAIGFCITALASFVAARNTRHTRKDAKEARQHAASAEVEASEARRQTKTSNGETLGQTTEHVRVQVSEGVQIARDVQAKLDEHLDEAERDRAAFREHMLEVKDNQPLVEYIRKKLEEEEGSTT